MAIVMTPIYTQTVGSGGAASVTFNNIPQSYTDLKIVLSGRESAIADFRQPVFLTLNNSVSSFSDTLLIASNSSAQSYRNNYTNKNLVAYVTGSTATANTFSNVELYLPNYTNSNFKQIICDSVVENNSSSNYLLSMSAVLFSSTSAITSLKLETYTTFAQYSTFSLYGIIRSGA